MKFEVIVADPPWLYRDQKNKDPAMGGVTYDVMSDETLFSLNVRSVTADNAVLFLWVTLPKLEEGIQLVQHWGFKYITSPFVWVKLNPLGEKVTDGADVILKKGVYSGLGHWTNGNVELVLMGKKGKPVRKNKNVKQVVIHPRTRHSQKPEDVQTSIENLIDFNTPGLELFARRKRPNWLCVGDEVTGNDIVKDLKYLSEMTPEESYEIYGW